MIEDIVNENIDQFRSFWLDLENKLKYIDLFKRGITSGNTLGLFFIKDSKAVLELTRYYKDFKKIVIYDAKGTINLLKDYDSIDEFNDPRVEYVYVGQNLPMKFDKIIMNPPYNLGNKITEAVLSSLSDDGDCVCLMPLSQYKAKGLYKHVDSFELADPGLFEDAIITNSLSICTLYKSEVCNVWKTKDDISISAADKHYTDYYMWNVSHNKNIAMRQIRDQELLDAQKEENLDTYFFETIKCSAIAGKGGGFGPNGFGYKWNINKQIKFNNAFAGVIIFASKQAKDNFQKWWYNGKIDESMSSRVILGINNENFVGTGYFAIPQIDWSNIHINQKELWDKGDYDEAVLSEMGLKWNADKTVIIKDE